MQGAYLHIRVEQAATRNGFIQKNCNLHVEEKAFIMHRKNCGSAASEPSEGKCSPVRGRDVRDHRTATALRANIGDAQEWVAWTWASFASPPPPGPAPRPPTTMLQRCTYIG